MFTSFWNNVLRAVMTQEDISDGYTSLTGVAKKITAAYAPDTLRIGWNPSSENHNCPSLYKPRATNGMAGVIFGTGTTPPTKNDVNLSGDLITTFGATVSVSTESEDNAEVIRAVYTLTNTGSAAFTIGEIGLIAQLYSSSNVTGSKHMGLLERTLLEAPVTIPAGGVGQVTYTIRLDFPVA